MKIRIGAVMLMALLVVSLLPNPFLPVRLASAAVIDISTPAELAAINASTLSLAGEYRLTNDIDLAGYDNGDHEGWLPLGKQGSPFTGTLNGNGYAIRNMSIDRANNNNVGLFGQTSNATITNVHLTNITVKGYRYVGGIAGDASQTSITNSYAEGNVTGNESVGVLVGYNDFSNISDSYAQGQVSIGPSPEDSFGGAIGYSSGLVTRVYSIASVGSGSYSGGLIGQRPGGAVTSSYWNTETSGMSTSDGGDGKTTAEMKRKATYVGWDFTNTWGLIEEATYPLLRSDYTKVALASLTVEDTADNAPQALDRAFSDDYGVYVVRVVSKTDQVTVAGTALSGTSNVSVDGGSGTKVLSLNPGPNDFQIKVSDATDPTRLNAIYKLTVIRDAGTAGYPHRITTAEQLSKIGNAAEGYGMGQVYLLENDLDLSAFSAGAGWMPVGNTSAPFSGSFDGQNHAIANIGIQRAGTDGIGLFGSTSSASIKNIALLGTNIHGKDKVGALIGEAVNTTVSGVSVQGAVYGVNKVGGLAGVVDGVFTISKSYSAATVSGSVDKGGLIGYRNGGTVSDSFWDITNSGQADLAGGTGLTTGQMMQQATFAAAGWEFGSGKQWGMIEGTTYPMPYASLGGVLLNGMTVTAPGATVSLNAAFDSLRGSYAATLNTPVTSAHIAVTAADTAGAHVAMNGTAGSTGDINLKLGDNPVEIRVTDAAGLWQGVYRLKIIVPTPQPSVVEVPANGTYGVGQQLDFTVTFTKPVDVAGTPELPLQLNGVDRAALYTGKLAGHPEKLQFSYTVQSGDQDTDGIELGTAIGAVSPAAITALGDTVGLDLPISLPSLSHILVDGIAPTISLTPSVTVPTNNAITVTVNADGTGSTLAPLKWAESVQDAVYFTTSGTVLTGGAFQVSTNGTYTVFARDGGGNTFVKTIEITNIVTDAPAITLTYTPMTLVSTGVDLTVTATVYGAAAGNALTDLRWAEGEHIAGDFTSPLFGADVPLSGVVPIAQNGKYTVYAADSAGNRQVKTIEITNILTDAPQITLTYTPLTIVNTGIDLTVTADVYNTAAGNALTDLRWAKGEYAAVDFTSSSFGTGVPLSGIVRITQSGIYTVFAADSAGNKQVKTIEITNIITDAPEITLSYTPMTPVSTGVDLTVTAAVYNAAAGNALTDLRWAQGEHTDGDFAAPSFGTDVPLSGIIRITQNGTYTIFAADSVGNKQVKTINIANIVSPSSSTDEQVGAPAGAPGSFAVVPGKEYTLKIAGATLFIPIGAIEQPMTITMQKITDDVKALLQSEQLLLSDVYEFKKDVPGKFKLPVQLSIDWTDAELVRAQKRPVLAYYDETTLQWVSIGGRADGNTLAGKTDHFTKFAVIALAEETEPGFTDISGHWAEQAIRDGVVKGLVHGYPDGTFRPDTPVSRAEFALMLQRIMAWPDGNGLSFEDQRDIPSWASGAVAAAVHTGIVSGYPDNTFHPNTNINRAEVTVLIAKAAKLKIASREKTTFADNAAIADWSMPYVSAAQEAGLVQGQSGNQFHPIATTTRAEAAVLLLRLAAYIQSQS
ncbi:S-layer homology domain-containing protein [Paenibacillus oryzisoli]|uniref:SLH domain-containing protein n=1 Tax=Paenibacillus oryzisoli TaxID=1850517 RepID=A0A198A3F8_9BACL|nr:S-layer homology domain-containing protein [Paenibacillus oryzisoli]OAS15523.1 hypothetical protein A8708_13990 [Paenibacillus oryzisoli]